MKRLPLRSAALFAAEIPMDAGPRRATEWLAELCLKQGWCFTPGDALEAAELWSEEFLRQLRVFQTSEHSHGRVCRFEFNSSSDDYLQGVAFVEPRQQQAGQSGHERLEQVPAVQDILSALTPREFEGACRGILHAFGAVDYHVTPASNDEGIDFFGRIPVQGGFRPSPNVPGLDRQIQFWVVGQAKHYSGSTKVVTPDIRELVGSVALLRMGDSTAGRRAEYFRGELRACDPVLHLFITTGTITQDGWALLRGCGVAGMDGGMVSSFLALRGIGVSGDSVSLESLTAWAHRYLSSDN